MNPRRDIPRPSALRSELTAKSWLTEAAPHAAEQPRPRSRREPGSAWSSTAASARGAQLGVFRPDHRHAEDAGRRPDAAHPVGQAGRRFAPTPTRRACCSPTQPGAALGDVGALPRTRPRRA